MILAQGSRVRPSISGMERMRSAALNVATSQASNLTWATKYFSATASNDVRGCVGDVSGPVGRCRGATNISARGATVGKSASGPWRQTAGTSSPPASAGAPRGATALSRWPLSLALGAGTLALVRLSLGLGAGTLAPSSLISRISGGR